MTTRDEDILDFDFFGEEEPPSWDEPTERGETTMERLGSTDPGSLERTRPQMSYS